jgi:cytochrome P450
MPSPLPPRAPGVPLLGNAMSMKGDAQAFLVSQYRMLGPIFRIRALSHEITVMAGPEANRFLRTGGDEVLSSVDTFGGLDREFGMSVHSLTGRPHRHLRARLAQGMSSELLRAGWDPFVALTERHLDGWRPGSVIPVVDQFQRLAAAQVSRVFTGAAATAEFATLRRALELAVEVTVAGKWPAAALRLPSYRRAKTKAIAFAQAALAERAAHPHEGPMDLLDHALAATDENGAPYPPRVRVGLALQGYFGALNTVAYLYSFLLYALLRHPDVLTRITAEVGRVVADGRLSFDSIRDLTATQGLVLETLRVYPPAPVTSRTAARTFEFHGYRIDRGTRVMVATTVPHHLPEHFENPGVFDIARDFREKRRTDVYAPFSVGSHACLGAGMTEVLGTATVAILVSRVRLRLPSADYRLAIQSTPGPNPGKRFRVTVV